MFNIFLSVMNNVGESWKVFHQRKIQVSSGLLQNLPIFYSLFLSSRIRRLASLALTPFKSPLLQCHLSNNFKLLSKAYEPWFCIKNDINVSSLGLFGFNVKEVLSPKQTTFSGEFCTLKNPADVGFN